MIILPRAICNDLPSATRREWLTTDGLGGYACGTVGGELARKYHGLLVAATAPPGKRVLLLAALDAEVIIGGAIVPLACNRWADGSVSPRGDVHIESFRLVGQTPTWRYAIGGVALDREIWMRHGEPTTCVRWTLRRGGPLLLRLRALASCRSHHAVATGNEPAPTIVAIADGVVVGGRPGATPLVLRADRGKLAAARGERWRNYLLAMERARGYDAVDAHDHVATLEATLRTGESVTVVASAVVGTGAVGDASKDAAATRPLDVAAWRHEQRTREGALLAQAGIGGGGAASGGSAAGLDDGPDRHAPRTAVDALRARLVLAADQFIVRRRLPSAGGAADAPSRGESSHSGASVMAGYPWFEDWGRDTMIALPGLCLATGRLDEARQILRTFAASVDRGMIPNRFPDEGGAPEYHTVDATLWFVEAIARMHARTQDDALLRELWPKLEEIVRCHVEGTRHGIKVDPVDGLLRAGEPGVQLTWMDAKIGDRVVTPRIGKPVEIAALWYSALRRLATFADRLGMPLGSFSAAQLRDMAERARRGFARFRNTATGCLFDVIDAPGRGAGGERLADDGSIRPNQLVAAGLAESPVDDETAKAIVEVCTRDLLTSHGLRTLSRRDPLYRPRYEGDQPTRDAAYHQGTVWAWLIGPYVAALRRATRDEAPVRDVLEALALHLQDAGLGSVSEVFDGDAPHWPGGCFAQAWSVGALLDSISA